MSLTSVAGPSRADSLPLYEGVTLCLLTDMVSCALVVVILVVTPWRHVWRTYVRTAV